MRVPESPGATHEVPALATLAVSVVLIPLQMVSLVLMVKVGAGSTVTSTWSVEEQPLLVPVTVYVVVVFAVKGVLLLIPLFQE